MRKWLVGLFLVGSVSAAEPAKSFQEMNNIIGLQLWKDDSLWDDSDKETAQRLSWPQESQTDTQASYRWYPPSLDDLNKVLVLGAQVYSLALYAETGKVTQVSLMFINKGDYTKVFVKSSLSRDAMRDLMSERRKRLRGFSSAFRKDREAIEKTLTTALGPSKQGRFGQSSQTAESVKRWDWKGHSLLLAAPSNDYIGLRIVPTALADAEGKTQKISDSKLREILAKRVVKRPNGDVVVSQIPMVDQGPKGFCVPATWERYLRYVGIPVDMYVLAMAGETEVGGGTYVEDMVKAVNNLIGRSGRRLDKVSRALTVNSLADFIDKGLPLMWGIYQQGDLDYKVTNRTEDRKEVTDWKQWLETLKTDRRNVRRHKLNKDNTGHMCLIIGYNKATDEVAVSDSWGPQFAERWMTVEEAQYITQGDFYVISW